MKINAKNFAFMVILISELVMAQLQRPTEQSNPNLDFNTFLSGVRVAYLQFNDNFQKEIDSGNFADYVAAMVEYCNTIGIKYVAYKTEDKDKMINSISSACDVVFVNCSAENKNGYLQDIELAFSSCVGDNFIFKSNNRVKLSEGWTDALKTEWLKLYRRWSSDFNINARLKLPSNRTEWNQALLKKHFDQGESEYIEGIWEKIRVGSNDVIDAKYLLGVIKNIENGYDIVYLDGANQKEDWSEGEFKGKIVKSANKNIYSVKWVMAQKQLNEDVYCNIDDMGLLTFVFSNTSENNPESKFLKIYPTTASSKISNSKGTATAFAISQDGYVVTCHHVIKSRKSFKIFISSADTISTFTLTKIGEDPNNDLALLKISDPAFKGFTPLPFSIREKQSDVGDELFVLGFPLTTSMGNELKLTNGIISSRSGFQGDLTAYQISAAVQPGNSGGPVFDREGGLMGVITAKHLGTENVSYAVKSTLLNNLLESLNVKIKHNIKNVLKGKSLSEQVKILRKYVFMIEVE